MNLDISIIEVDGKYIDLSTFDKFLKELNNGTFNEIILKAFKQLKKLNNKEEFNFLVKDFISELDYGLENIKFNDTNIKLYDLFFSIILLELEKRAGDILAPTFKNYDDILKYQTEFQSIKEYYSDKDLVCFTAAQEKQKQQAIKNFNIDFFKFVLNLV